MSSFQWADTALSRELSDLRRSGESQSVEFKREVPEQVRDLAKEIAAFASSNDGVILLGVSDNGSLTGLPGAEDQRSRDDLLKRIAGVSKLVIPPVRPALVWAVENGRAVLAIRVSKGREPLYYVDHRPYIRHLSISRPAEAAEVIDAVRSHLAQGKSAWEPSSETEFFSALAGVLVVALRWGDTDPSIRSLKPWVDEWMFEAEQAATTLRDLASDTVAIERDLVDRLGQMADLLDAIASFTHTLGNGNSFDAVTAEARDKAWLLMDQVIRPISLSSSTGDEVREAVAKMARKLTDLWRRAAANLFDGSVEKGQSESGQIGRKLMEFSYYALDVGADDAPTTLRKIGQRLVALEARHLYMDGGISQRGAAEEGLACASALTESVSYVQP